MAIRRSRVFNARRRSNRSWAGVAAADVTNVPAASKVLLGSFAPTVSGDITAIRSVGYITISSDNDTGDELQLGAFGMIKVTDTALGIGVTAVPGPVTDIADDGWLLYQSFGFEMFTHTTVGQEPGFGHMIQFDSKGKRIVSDGQSLAIMVENAHASHGFDITFSIRLLSLIGSQ